MLPERDVLKAVLAACAAHPQVAWVERINVGAVKKGSRWIRFAFPGCSDVIGMLKDGRFLAIEVKREDGRISTEQVQFLGMVERSGGVAFVARSAADVDKGITYSAR